MSYSSPIIFWVIQTFSSAYTASTPPWPLAAIKVRYSAADERTMEIAFFWEGCAGLRLLMEGSSVLALGKWRNLNAYWGVSLHHHTIAAQAFILA
jgi:hypothetical protein